MITQSASSHTLITFYCSWIDRIVDECGRRKQNDDLFCVNIVQALNLVLNASFGKDIAKSLEWHLYKTLFGTSLAVTSLRDFEWYIEVDRKYSTIRGCPVSM